MRHSERERETENEKEKDGSQAKVVTKKVTVKRGKRVEISRLILNMFVYLKITSHRRGSIYRVILL